jgi:hypothetical protein
MANQQRLKLTLRNHVSDRTWTNQPLEVTADYDDNPALLAHLESMARNLDYRTGAPWWMDQYTMRVQGVDQHWLDKWITGAGN